MTVPTTRGIQLRSHTGTTYWFDAGALCLELLTTGGPGPFRRYEVLHAPADLADWVRRSRLRPTPELEIVEAEILAARNLRDALFQLVMTRVAGESDDPSHLSAINDAAARPPLAPAIAPDGRRRWGAEATGTHLLATVARDAVDLLTGPLAQRIRTCAASDCHLIYVDTSRPGSRRWCSMEHCGNLHKVRASRARHSNAP